MSKMKIGNKIQWGIEQSKRFHAAALKAKEKDPSNPFAYATALCHMRNGITVPADYE